MKSNNIYQKETILSDGKTNNYNFDLVNYGNNLNNQKIYISGKITSCEIKLTSLKSKEAIIDKMISSSSNQLDKANEEQNYKIAGVISRNLTGQFETLSAIQEMLIKYEDMIQKYVKMNIDIENHKINAFTKLESSKKTDLKEGNDYGKLMAAVHKMIDNQDGSIHSDQTGTNVPMMDEVRQQLKLEGY